MSRIAEAELLLTRLETTLDPALLEAQHQTLAKLVADLSHPRASAAWLRYLALRSLLTGQIPRELKAALDNSEASEVSRPNVALARMLQQLAAGRLDAAGRTLSRSDDAAERNALFQTAAGLVLERAEPAAAARRYEKALTLNPHLGVAVLYLARLSLWTSNLEKAREVLAAHRNRWGQDARFKALDAMAWLTDLEEVAPPPASIRLDGRRAEQLPPTLDFVPLWLDVRGAEGTEVRETACAVAATSISAPHPKVALFWLAEQALQARCIDAARTAAARLLTVSEGDARATQLFVLAELAEGHVDEAERRVTSVSDAESWKSVLAAIRAYERGVAKDIEVDPSTIDPKALAAARAFASVLRHGGPSDDPTLSALARPTSAWGELVSVDAALNHGKLKLAEQLVSAWPDSYQSPAHLLRLSRLRRYQGKTAEAVNLSEAAAYGDLTRPSLTERVLALLQHGEDTVAAELVVHNSQHLGPLATWLGALAKATSAQRVAQRRLERVELPAAEAPLGERVVAALALTVAEDDRARDWALQTAKTCPEHPDLNATGWLDG